MLWLHNQRTPPHLPLLQVSPEKNILVQFSASWSAKRIGFSLFLILVLFGEIDKAAAKLSSLSFP
jgi:hypothetical protein